MTIDALASSVTRLGAGDLRRTPGDLVADICLGFHYLSILMTRPLGLLVLAPLVQIALMTYVLCLVFRARERSRLK